MTEKDFERFKDYRLLIKELFIHYKIKTKGASLQNMASKVGVSKSYIKMVMDGQRHFSLDKISAVSNFFKMSGRQKDYFYFLYLESQVEDKELKTFFSNMRKMTPSPSEIPARELERFFQNKSIFANSSSMILSSLQRFENFEDDPSWIQKQLRDKNIETPQWDKALQDLRDRGNNKEFVNGHGATPNSFEFYKVGLEMAAKAMEQTPTYRPANFCMMSIGVDSEAEREAFAAFQRFKETLTELSKKTQKPTSVLFVSNSIFCVAEDEETANLRNSKK